MTVSLSVCRSYMREVLELNPSCCLILIKKKKKLNIQV